jgi:cyclic pyranopterin phosphate synthase
MTLAGPPHTQTAKLVDQFGRVATDLRVSVTDRCDLRCTYCMPAEGMQWLPREEVLRTSEIVDIVTLLHQLGIESVRLTGGEPLVRADIVDIVDRLSSIGLRDLSLTTNGTRLARLAPALAESGLQRVNVSVDSLKASRYALMTRRDVLPLVLDGIRAAVDAGLSPVKVNCVLLRKVNEDELIDFAEFARNTGCEVRFIEPMPLDGDRQWDKTQVLPAAEIIERINAKHPLVPRVDVDDNAPATVYQFADAAPGAIGVIGSVSQPFCSTCDRLRLTADGQLRTCLFAENETDLRTPMRSGVSTDELTSIIANAVLHKQAGHAIGAVSFRPPNRTMSSIGG